jgi:lipoprotein-releasing system ATP-binding protein
MSDLILQAQGLSKQYDDGVAKADVLCGVDLSVKASELIAIVGSSGSGKSTLLHLLGGLEKPSEGEVVWSGERVSSLSERRKCAMRNRDFGFIYQFHHLLPEFSTIENVAMPLMIGASNAREAEDRAASLLKQVGLGHRLKHKVTQLSGGERQRVAIARAMVVSPRCILADEPTGNLDQKTASEVLAVMLALQSELKTSFVIVTHDQTLASGLQTCYALDQGVLKEIA